MGDRPLFLEPQVSVYRFSKEDPFYLCLGYGEGHNMSVCHAPVRSSQRGPQAAMVCYSGFHLASFFSCFPTPSPFEPGVHKSRLLLFNLSRGEERGGDVRA